MEARSLVRRRRMVPALLVVALACACFGAGVASAVAPTVTAENASAVSYTSAHAEGTVDPQGQETTCHFEFVSQAQLDENLNNGLSEWEGAPGAPCNVEPLTGTGAQAVEAQLEGLSPSTVYHLRLVASNADGQSEAQVSKFVLELKGGKKGLIENSEDLCSFTPRAKVQMTGQYGKTANSNFKLGTSC